MNHTAPLTALKSTLPLLAWITLTTPSSGKETMNPETYEIQVETVAAQTALVIKNQVDECKVLI